MLLGNCMHNCTHTYFFLHKTYFHRIPPDTIRLGDQNLINDNDDAKPENFQIAEIIRHPEFRPPRKYNDIALIRLDRKVTYVIIIIIYEYKIIIIILISYRNYKLIIVFQNSFDQHVYGKLLM